MGTTLELVYKYRQLIGQCDAGCGLDLDGIDQLMTIEALFASDDPASEVLASERVSIKATLRNESLDDGVTVVSMGPTGCVCRQAPYADEGETLELVIDDPEASLSYRFKAIVSSLRDDVNDDFALSLDLVGVPLLVHYGLSGDMQSVVEQIAA